MSLVKDLSGDLSSSLVSSLSGDFHANPTFAPTSITGLSLWLDASDAATITHAGGAVSQWDDKSGSGRHVSQSSAAAQPTTNTRTLNGLNVVDFNSNDYLDRNDALGLTGNPDFTAFIVAKYDSLIQQNDRVLHLGKKTASNEGQSLAVGTGIAGYSYRFNNGFRLFGAADISSPDILIFERSSGDAYDEGRFWKNGGSEEIETDSSVGGTLNLLDEETLVGAGRATTGDLNSYIDAYVAEIIVYNTVLSAAEKTAVGTYLANKWGLTMTEIAVPHDVTGLQLWLDASDTATIIESGGNISQWDDKSGQDNHATQTTGSLQFTYGTDGTGGHLLGTGPASNAGANEYMNIPDVSGRTVFFVGDVDTFAAGGDGRVSGIIASNRPDADIESYIFLTNQESGSGIFDYGASVDGSGSDVASWYVNGSLIGSGGNIGAPSDMPTGVGVHAFEFTPPDPLRDWEIIGAVTAAGTDVMNRGFLGKIREILVYDDQLSTADRQKIENYLANKWGVTF